MVLRGKKSYKMWIVWAFVLNWSWLQSITTIINIKSIKISKINFALADNLEHAKPLLQLRHHIPRRRHTCADLWGVLFDDQLSFLEKNIFRTFLVSLRLHWRQSWYVRIFLKSSPILLCSPHYALWEQIWGGLRERHRRRGQSGWEEWWCWQKPFCLRSSNHLRRVCSSPSSSSRTSM